MTTKAKEVTNERVINGRNLDDSTAVVYVTNPKRQNSNAGRRYELYQKAKTIGEYFKIFEDTKSLDRKFALPDLRHDELKGFIDFGDEPKETSK